ncbi:MAG: glycosyltransferase family 4 protein [Armatimonadetes bacterium]|nr:glycosyltransferase family 4 protein [Armatimonadota bacterium]
MTESNLIAVNARSLVRPRSGIGVYTENVLRHAQGSGLQFLLLADNALTEEQACGWESRTLTLPFVSLEMGKNYAEPLWFHWLLPKAISTSRARLFWSPYFYVPWRCPVPTIATVHDTNPLDVPVRDHPWLWRRYFLVMLGVSAKQARHIIVPSRRIADNLIAWYGVPAEKISVIYHGVGEEFASPPNPNTAASLRERVGLERPFVLFVGNLGERKNAMTLVRAYAQLPPALRNEYALVIVGPSGCDETAIREFVTSENLTTQVKLVGYVHHNDLPELYKMATVFAMPSLCESFGIPIIEAMAAGIPVLAADNTSIPEIAGDAAILLPARDVSKWANGLALLLSDNNAREDLRRRGLKRAAFFSWPKSAEEHMKVFREHLA